MCWKCGKQNNVSGFISRSSVCEQCGADLRCCKNCQFYSPGSHFDCHETVEELVTDKERANFCESFSFVVNPSNVKGSGVADGCSARENAKKSFESLFGN